MGIDDMFSEISRFTFIRLASNKYGKLFLKAEPVVISVGDHGSGEGPIEIVIYLSDLP